MSVRGCLCGHAESSHYWGVGCIALARSGEDVRCPCKSFVMAGEQPALPSLED